MKIFTIQNVFELLCHFPLHFVPFSFLLEPLKFVQRAFNFCMLLCYGGRHVGRFDLFPSSRAF